MTNNEPDMLVQRFVDGDLTDAEVQQALHRIADDAEARDLLQFELRMTQDLAATRSGAPPADFADRTMKAVAQEPVPGEEPASFKNPLQALWEVFTETVTLQVRPVSATVALLLAGLVAWTVWPVAPTTPNTGSRTASTTSSETQTVQQTSAQPAEDRETVWIRFRYTNSEADSVSVAGDFSQWEPVALSPREVNGETVWTGLVPVSRGEHEYQFLINGERWVTDPLAPVKRSDGFGAKNAVLNI
jgi:hypothetical protein